MKNFFSTFYIFPFTIFIILVVVFQRFEWRINKTWTVYGSGFVCLFVFCSFLLKVDRSTFAFSFCASCVSYVVSSRLLLFETFLLFFYFLCFCFFIFSYFSKECPPEPRLLALFGCLQETHVPTCTKAICHRFPLFFFSTLFFFF